LMAERTGFEPAEGFNSFTGLANQRLKPLSHLSKKWSHLSGSNRRHPHYK
jgi:hypothetical protein